MIGARMRAADAGLVRKIIRDTVRRPGAFVAVLVAGFAFGVAYRMAFDPVAERILQNFLLSGLHGTGLAATVWIVQAAFISSSRAPLGLMLQRLPLAIEVVIRALIMTAALVVVGIALQVMLYAQSQHLHWFTSRWFTIDLPRIVASALALSLLIGLLFEATRLIGSSMLTSLLLGTYHRPTRRQMVVMFLDIANSTQLAESLGELRVHDLITKFFFDIDEQITGHGGTVHAYVGDEVIVSWPVEIDAALNARAISCFFAIERKMALLGPAYQAEFGLVPSFRAGINAGPVVVSECGYSKRQLAFFGDTMNVAARLCDHCKTVKARLVISGELLRIMRQESGMHLGQSQRIRVRGREAPVEALVVDVPDSSHVTVC